MKRYEAILEQLKNAQSRGMETFSNRLDFVVQSLEELIQEAKSSVQGALPQSADECLPLDEIEAALKAYRDEADAARQRAAELSSKISELESQLGKGDSDGISIELMRSLDRASSQSELLRELLPVLSHHAARAVVLVFREDTVSAWSGIGFPDSDRLRAWQGDVAASFSLTHVVDSAVPVKLAPSTDSLFSTWLAEEEAPTEVMLVPVTLRGKMMGAIYADRLSGHPWNPEAIQSLVALACWLIDTTQFRQTPAPMLAVPVEIDPPVDTQDRDAVETTTESVAEVVTRDEIPTGVAADEVAFGIEDPSATVRIDRPEEAVAAPVVPDEVEEPRLEVPFEPTLGAGDETGSPDQGIVPDPQVSTEVEIQPDDEPDFEPSAGEFEPEQAGAATGFDAEVASPAEDQADIPAEEAATEVEPPQTEVVETPTEVQIPVTPPVEEPEPRSEFLDEPPPVQPVQPPPEEPETEVSEDEAQQEEARRFARLLVSEIKLYNEEQVERGREDQDIYKRLQDDIDRSREMFNKRISPEIREKRDYFTDELVRILADGNADDLGM